MQSTQVSTTIKQLVTKAYLHTFGFFMYLGLILNSLYCNYCFHQNVFEIKLLFKKLRGFQEAFSVSNCNEIRPEHFIKFVQHRWRWIFLLKVSTSRWQNIFKLNVISDKLIPDKMWEAIFTQKFKLSSRWSINYIVSEGC